MWVRPLDWEDPLEKEMATHSSIIAWKISWMGSLARYSPWGYKEMDVTEHAHTQLHTIQSVKRPSSPYL